MRERKWTLFHVVMQQRSGLSLWMPGFGALGTGLLILLITAFVPPFSSDAIARAFVVLACQLAGSLTVFFWEAAHFAKHRLERSDWQLMSIAGTGPRLARGIWMPPTHDAFLMFAISFPLALYASVLVGTERWQFLFVEAIGLCVLVVVALLAATQQFVGLNGKVGYLLSRQLRWIIPVGVILFGGQIYTALIWNMPNANTTLVTWTAVVAVLATIAFAAILIARAFEERFLALAVKDFGSRPEGVQLKDVDRPKRLGGKTTRNSHPLRSRFPCFEREIRALAFGPTGAFWLIFVTFATIGLILEFNGSQSWRETGVMLRWTSVIILGMTGCILALTLPTSRFDAEAKQQTITSLILAISGQRYVRQVLAATMLAVLFYLSTAAAIALLSQIIDDGPLPAIWPIGGFLVLSLASGYFCLVGAVFRLKYTSWIEQVPFLMFAVGLAPIMIFVVPSLTLQACDQIDEDPPFLEKGMSNKAKKPTQLS